MGDAFDNAVVESFWARMQTSYEPSQGDVDARARRVEILTSALMPFGERAPRRDRQGVEFVVASMDDNAPPVFWIFLPGMLPSLAALLLVRSAYLYDARFGENVGMGAMMLAATAGVALTFLTAVVVVWVVKAEGVRTATAAMMSTLSVLVFVLWVASHDGRCIAGCGPF